MPEISVIVPVYKVEPYLRRCIDSILGQTYTDFELILVDDGSPDNCPVLCDEYACFDSRVRVIHQENAGQSAARNRAVEAAAAQWLCFVDSDDAIHPQMLELLFRAVQESGAPISMCDEVEGAQIPDGFGQKIELDYDVAPVNEDFYLDLHSNYKYPLWVIWAKLIRKDIYTGEPLEEGRIYEDSPAMCKWFWMAKYVAHVKGNMYYYQINLSGTTKKEFSLKRLDSLWSISEQFLFYRDVGFAQMYKKLFMAYFYRSKEILQECTENEKDSGWAKTIRHNVRKAYFSGKGSLTFTKNEKYFIFEIVMPKTMKIYWYAVAAKNKVCCIFRRHTDG